MERTKERIDQSLHSHVQALSSALGIGESAKAYFSSHAKLQNRSKQERESFAYLKSQQAAWMMALATTKPTFAKALGFASKDEFYLRAMELMKEENWPTWKCTSIEALRKKMRPFNKVIKDRSSLSSALEFLVSGKFGNQNAGKLGTEQKAFIVKLYSMPKVGYKMVFRIYIERVRQMIDQGFWSEHESNITISTLRSFLIRPETMVLWQSPKNNKG